MPDSFKIDTHVHVFTTDMPLIDNPRHAPKYSFTHEELVATLDNNGINRAVIAAASPWGDYNDYILAALRAHRARLRGTAIFNGPVERHALEAMSRDGFVGMRLPFIGLPRLPDITTFNYRALFRRLADLDWHVHPHVEGEEPVCRPRGTVPISGHHRLAGRGHSRRHCARENLRRDGAQALLQRRVTHGTDRVAAAVDAVARQPDLAHPLIGERNTLAAVGVLISPGRVVNRPLLAQATSIRTWSSCPS